MRSDRVIATTDFHTAGIGMRLVTSGLGRVPGASMAEKRRWFEEHLDHLRTGLCLEPRGHREPPHRGADRAGHAGRALRAPLHLPGRLLRLLRRGDHRRRHRGHRDRHGRRGAARRRPCVIDTEGGRGRDHRALGRRAGREVTLRWTPSFVALSDAARRGRGGGRGAGRHRGGRRQRLRGRRGGAAGRRRVAREHARRIAQRGMAVRAGRERPAPRGACPASARPPWTTSSSTSCPTPRACRPTRSCGARARSTRRRAARAPARAWRCSITAACMDVGSTPGEPRASSGCDFPGRIAGETTVDGRPAILPEITGTAYLTGLQPVPLRSRTIPSAPAFSWTPEPMKTLVLGGGVVGVTTAYFLAKAGHEVTLLEEKDGARARGHRRQRRDHRARPLLRVGLAARAAHAVAVAARRRDGDPRAAQRRPPALRVGAPLPARVHDGARAAQHARQAAPLPVQPGRAQRGGAGRGDRVPGDHRGALYLHRDPAELEAGIKKMALLAEHGQKQEILDAAGARPARAGLRAGAGQDRRRHPRPRRLERRLAAVLGGAGARVPREARRHRQARHARDARCAPRATASPAWSRSDGRAHGRQLRAGARRRARPASRAPRE